MEARSLRNMHFYNVTYLKKSGLCHIGTAFSPTFEITDIYQGTSGTSCENNSKKSISDSTVIYLFYNIVHGNLSMQQ